MAQPDLPEIRARIDALDGEILERLRQRASIVEEVISCKRQSGEPVYHPNREREILERVAGTDLGDFPKAAAEAVFREIIIACRGLQSQATVAFLGPTGSFTEMAARRLYGAAVGYQPLSSIRQVFSAVTRSEAHYGVVPVENSTAGTIREVLDLLADTRLTIVGETFVDVHHCLLSHAPLKSIRVVYSKDTALEQCRGWLAGHLPRARLVATDSTTAGARRAAGTRVGAAIAPLNAGDAYGLGVVAENIEDRQDNRTRFFALGHDKVPASGRDKTSLVLAVSHRPGALVQALGVLRDHQLNMTLIESRPSPYRAFEYLFYIDLEGHETDASIQGALAEMRGVCLLCEVLGSYPLAG
ncbi:MAG: prephenate dehydratase [Armatimonadetes bacterium]|nr:prephenate dehydratase [Armatimonadota bacterium]